MDFMKFKHAVAAQFERIQQGQLYRKSISGDELWATYLGSFPEGTNPIYRERTEHDCSCCKQFIRTVGNVVGIIDGSIVSIWDVVLDDEYQVVANALSALAKSKPIDSVFLHYERSAGTDKNFEDTINGVKTWNHFHVNIKSKFIVDKYTIGTKLGELNTSREMLARALATIDNEAIETVLELIGQNSLYRGQEHLKAVSDFKVLKNLADIFGRKEIFSWIHFDNYVSRIRNTVIGTLLVDLSEGRPLDQAVKAFEDKVAPANYKRPTALVTKSMIEAAKKKVEELGLVSALERRYATINDITINNILYADRSRMIQIFSDDVFNTITAKADKPKLDKIESVTIDDFIENILPKAESIEIMVENRHANNFVSLIAPVDATARNMFKWDNPFSWSYSGNVTDSIKERVKEAGGNVSGDVCCRLAWFNFDDLDLHMIEPNGHEIYFGNRRQVSQCGGMLDVDMNGCDGRNSRTPVENIFYRSKGKMRIGEYKLFVHNYNRRETKDVGFEIEIDVLGTTYNMHYEKAVSQSSNIDVAKIRVKSSGEIVVKALLPTTTASKDYWNIKTQQFQKVNVIMNSPNFWDDQGVGNKHYFFMIDGCRNQEQARGFYNEFLINELDQHRKVIEMVGNKMMTSEAEHQLSGLGFSSTQRNSVLLRIKGSFTRTINVTF